MRSKILLLGALGALAIGAGLAGCSTLISGVKTTAKAVYGVASVAVEDYCALPQAARAAGQLVLVGKVYNSGLCDVVNSDDDLKVQLASASAQQVNTLIAAKVDAAVASGTISQAQAETIRGADQASSTAAVEAVVVTAGAKEGEAAAVVTEGDDSAPAAKPA